MEFKHIPVLLNETIEGLDIKPEGLYIDCTVGGAGHSTEICKRLTTGRLIGIDRDPDAVKTASERLAGFNATVVRANYSEIESVMSELSLPKADGILMDLGVSSFQLDNVDRGFTYNEDGPLDMRMSKEGMTAADFLNTADERQIADVLYTYGEEKFSRKIASAIVRHRENKKLETAFELNEIIREAVPAKYIREKNPSKKTFQALRIHVNGEFDHLKEGLEAAFRALAPGGRLCVISFHSLEDRIVKQRFSAWAKGCICPPDFPVCVCGRKPMAKIISGRGITAAKEELSENRRSRSAKLRICERTEEEYREEL